ncbi:MAG: DNA primase [Kiritimatiellae bacterium]|nr:DNA primase [Kiritimatiellia bacterium]
MSKGITESTIEEIKARTDLADLIASYGVVVKSAGATKKACCPFHHEKTPSFNINDSKGLYHCFGCGESGDAIKFVQKMEGLTFIEAVKKLAEACGVKIEEGREDPAAGRRRRLHQLLAELTQFYRRCLAKTKEGELARAYLKERDLGAEVCEEYQLGYALNGVSNILKWGEKYGYTPAEIEAAGVIRQGTRPGDLGYHRFSGRLMFPIRDRRGRVVGFSGRQLVASKNSGKYVNSPETEVFKKSRVLYGFDKAAGAIAKTKNHEAIVCEGQIDCIRLQTSGFPNAVAGQGTAFTGEHVEMLSKVCDQVVLVYDDDAAGHKATVKSARLCLAAGLPVRVVSLPGGDDPDSFLRAHPADDFRKMLDGAESIMSFQVRAARAAEANPGSVDAVARITREVLATIAQCPNAVVKAAMTGEAAKLLGLPSAALVHELEKAEEAAAHAARHSASNAAAMREDGADPTADGNSDDDQERPESIRGEDAGAATPPPPKELALCSFLMENEYDKTLDSKTGELLPRKVFAHDFTARFVDTWRAEVACGQDLFADFAGKLAGREAEWFAGILKGAGKAESSGLGVTDILQEFVRHLWMAALNREKGALPASGDAEAEKRRLQISADVMRIAGARWHDVKKIVANYTKGDNRKWT